MKRGQFNHMNPTHFDFGASLRKAPGVSSFNRLVRQYRANAKSRGLVFNLTDDQVRALTSKACRYCGRPPLQRMQMRDANGPYFYNGIDRRNPSLGYVARNCTPCCKRCNGAKGNMTASEWRRFILDLLTHNSEPKGKVAA